MHFRRVWPFTLGGLLSLITSTDFVLKHFFRKLHTTYDTFVVLHPFFKDHIVQSFEKFWR